MMKLALLLFLSSAHQINCADYADSQLPIWQQQHLNDILIATNPQGNPVPSLTASLTVGPDGPVLLQDSNLIDHLAHLNREKIPQRILFADGAGAHGVFQLAKDLSHCTKAGLFSDTMTKTPVFCRFSLAVRDAEYPEATLDMRGLACKFYTSEGNWDLLTGTGLVFPIRDPMLFPSLVHSHRKNPVTNLCDMNALWDFRSLRPETIFSTLTTFSDMGLPADYRHISTSAMSTFKLINDNGDVTLARFHLASNQGPQNLTFAEAAQVFGTRRGSATRDLYDAIACGNYPVWTLNIQLMSLDQATSCKWNPFDPTKVWSPSQFPLIPIGTIMLNKNVANYFAETETVAFSHSTLIPGLDLTLDPLNSARAFAYKDAQRYRLGPNFAASPINSPVVLVNSYMRDGHCPFHGNGGGGPNYYPNSFNGPQVQTVNKVATEKIQGIVARWDTGDEDNFSQPRLWLSTLTSAERERLVNNIANHLRFATEDIRNRMYKQFCNVTMSLGTEIKDQVTKLDMLEPTKIQASSETNPSKMELVQELPWLRF